MEPTIDDPSLSEPLVATCPRCELVVRYLVPAYWKPPDHPGFCSICCEEACALFDRDGWPEQEV